MNKRSILAAATAAILGIGMITGCASAEQKEDAAAQNRAYMSQANTAAMQLNADLAPFTAAVAADDLVTMEQAAASVYRDIDAFEGIKAPDAMKEIHKEYSAGCEDLKEALESYIDIYKEAADADVSTLNGELAGVQEQYDSGIAHLQAADKMVTELTGALPSSSSSAKASSSSSSKA